MSQMLVGWSGTTSLVLAAEWWSNAVVVEVQASVMFHAAWDVACCLLLFANWHHHESIIASTKCHPTQFLTSEE
jgi:hypothetical protein